MEVGQPLERVGRAQDRGLVERSPHDLHAHGQPARPGQRQQRDIGGRVVTQDGRGVIVAVAQIPDMKNWDVTARIGELPRSDSSILSI